MATSGEPSIEDITDRLNRALSFETNSRRGTASINGTVEGFSQIQKDQIKSIFRELIGQDAVEEDRDQPIGEIRIDELNKIPDIVKTIREFSGKVGEFGSWRKSVDRVLELYDSIRGTSRYYAILHTVRTKIIGEADTALDSYRTPLDWGKIKKCLMMHYSDKRDLGTLEYQMTTMCQGGRTVTEFYQGIYQHLSLILDKVSCMELDTASLSAMTNSYREKALDTFIRGLRGDLPRLLSVREPSSLPQALHMCLKLENMNFRQNYAQGANRTAIHTKPPRQRFYPELAHIPTHYNRHQPQIFNQNFHRHNPNFVPFNGPKPFNQHFNRFNQVPHAQNHSNEFKNNYSNTFPKPTPMEIDDSNQLRRNSHNQNFKQPLASQMSHPPNKIQRNFHLEPQYPCETHDIYELGGYNYPILMPSSLPYMEYVTRRGDTIDFLIDTGSNKNYIQSTRIRNPIPNEKPFKVSSVAGDIEITHHTYINIFGEPVEKIKFYILPTLKSFHGIIGNDTLKKLKATIHTSQNFMVIFPNIKIPLKQKMSQEVNKVELQLPHLTQSQQIKLNSIIRKCPNLFSDPDEKLTFTTLVKGEIRTTTDSPVYSKPYPYPMALKGEVERQVEELLANGIIRKSKSPYNSPVWIVNKKMDSSGEKKYRMVIDYRKLNAVTIPDRYPIPEINEVLSNLGENKLFTVIDLKSGFHQILLRESDIEKTAFSINNGKYEFLRLPFGLKNAPSTFQRALDDILRNHIGKRCYVYIDDVIIFGRNEEEHLQNLEIVFKTLENANMKVQIDKCTFLKNEVEFLGYVVGAEGIKTNPQKVETISRMPAPKNLKELRSFLGMAGYYRRFIKDFAKIAKPLTTILRGECGNISKNASKNKLIFLKQEALDSFNKIKNILVSRDVVLSHPNFEEDFELTTDASDFAIGAVLSQNRRPITYISRTLNKTEEGYATNEKEMLAIIWSLNSLRNYLYGSKKVKIYTDHQPLTYALSSKNTNSKMKRWKSILEEYNYGLKYKPGYSNVVADALSRVPDQVNTLTSTAHSTESSPHDLIPCAEVPINVFKNQIFLKQGNTSTYQFKIIFPTVHRHIITEPTYNEQTLVSLLKRYLNPSVINGIHTEERIMGMIQNIYPQNFSNYKARYTQKLVEDIINEQEQENIILETHLRAHRNATENKAQILEKGYFPGMLAKNKNLIIKCTTCKENKYERHPNRPKLGETPLPTFPGHTVHIDIFLTEGKVVLTALDKFTKYAQTKILKSRSIEDVRRPLRDIIFAFGVPKFIVIDNEPSLNSASIKFMLEDELGIELFTTPPYKSQANGQVERFHSTLVEIMRCIKENGGHRNFEELLERAVSEYNHSIHSVTQKKPVDLFFGRNVNFSPDDIEKTRHDNLERLTRKQQQDIQYHNKNRHELKSYLPGQIIFIRRNKQLGTKLSKPYSKEIVKEDRNSTVITEKGQIIHKSRIRN